MDAVHYVSVPEDSAEWRYVMAEAQGAFQSRQV